MKAQDIVGKTSICSIRMDAPITEGQPVPPPPKPPPSGPYHELLSDEAKKKNAGKRRLDGRLRHDYLSKRYRDFCDLNSNRGDEKQPGKQGDDHVIWSGATSMERSLISCCTTGTEDEEDDEDSLLPGALYKDKIIRFVGLIALQCHDIASRSLALAILERTHELDELIYRNYNRARKDLEGESPEKKLKTGEGSSVAPIKPPPPRRLVKFLSSNGMRILSRWLFEASDPVESTAKAPPRSSSSKPRPKVPSPTGPLILPLLEFLQRIPFDKVLIKKSKINKEIRRVSKLIDNIVDAASSDDRWVPSSMTDPVSGGLSILRVQAAVNEVKKTWEARAMEESQKNPSCETVPVDPFQSISQKFKDRLDVLEKFEAGDCEKPEWLTLPSVEKEGSNKKRIASRKLSVEELAKKEHDNERAHLNKATLRAVQEEHRRLLETLRNMAATKAREEMNLVSSRRRVRWKDGNDPASRERNREQLEEVFVFVKEKAAAKGTVPGDKVGMSTGESD